MKPIIFISSHPIQYFAPLYQSLTAEGLPVEVYFCSTHGLDNQQDKEFATTIKWDIPLLTGYKYRFFKNYFTRPSIYRFFGLINPGLIMQLIKAPRSIVVIHGWSHFTNIMAMLAARLRGHVVCLRAETPLNHELLRSEKNRRLRRILLQRILFPWFQFFLYIGTQNKAFYRFYGVPENRLWFAPYAVDNKRFSEAFDLLNAGRLQQRAKMGIAENDKLLLFSGKYISKKRPLDLLEAFRRLQTRYSNIGLCMVGEGALRPAMEEFIAAHQLKGVRLTGFVNQQAIVEYYSAADIFIMCSGSGETWGLSANEAMNFRLPLVLSDLTGCAADLVEQGKNGYLFKTGDINDLTEKLSALVSAGSAVLKEAGGESAAIVKRYSYQETANTLRELACAY